jgi:hypothetical protein
MNREIRFSIMVEIERYATALRNRPIGWGVHNFCPARLSQRDHSHSGGAGSRCVADEFMVELVV